MSHPLQDTSINEGVLQVQKSMWTNMYHDVLRGEKWKYNIFLKLFLVYPFDNLLAFYTPSTKHVWGQEVDLLPKHLSEVLAELSVGSLSLQTLTNRDQELNEVLFPDTIIISFSSAFSQAGQQLHVCMSGAIGIYSPRGQTLKNLIRFVTEWRAHASQHCAPILI